MLVEVQAQSTEMKLSLGVSIPEEERQRIIDEYAVWNELTEEDIFIIDGVIINEYLQDGSNESTGVYSSSTVQINIGGNGAMWGGVEVTILTPGNITEVSETAYRNAALAAGAKSAQINIFSPVPVTGEGALVGMYEIFSESGMELDLEAIRIAELQLDIEQQLNEESELSSEDTSDIILNINYEISKYLLANDAINENDLKEIVEMVITPREFNLSDSSIEHLIQHASNYSSSPVAKDEESFAILENTLGNKKSLNDSLYSQEFTTEKGKLRINDVYILNEGDPQNYHNGTIIVFNISMTNETDEPKQYHEFTFSYIEPIQDNDPNIINELEVAGMVTEEDLEKQIIDIKPGGTMEMNMSYFLSDMETEVTLNIYPVEYREGEPETIIIDLSTVEVR